MAVDLGPVRLRLQSLLREISGLDNVPAYEPRALVEANLPIGLIRPGPAEYDMPLSDGTNAIVHTQREWALQLYFSKLAAGAYGDQEKAAEPFFAEIEDKMGGHILLDGLSGITAAYLGEDTGLTVLDYPPGGENVTQWIGVEWNLAVTTTLNVTIPSSLLTNAGDNERERIAAALETVGGVKRAYAYSPRGVTVANAPLFLVYPSEAEHDAAWAGGHKPERAWRLVLLAGKVGQGAYGDLQKVLDPFFLRVPDVLAGYLTLNGLSNVVNAVLEADSGPVTMEFPPGSGDEWYGTEWEFWVQHKRSMTAGV